MEVKEFWSKIGSKKTFRDPFYLEKLGKFITKDSRIIEYGCGYGRILNFLRNQGFTNLVGYDFAPLMLERGYSEYPDLDLRLFDESACLKAQDGEADVMILSTVLCCNPNDEEQNKIIKEICRILKPGGLLYLADFLITPSDKYLPRYKQYQADHTDCPYGTYLTREGTTVRHHTTSWIFELLKEFNVLWFEQFDHVTMNENPVRTFHSIARTKSLSMI